MWKGKRPSLGHIKGWRCEVFVRREAQDKLESRFKKCLFVGYPKESFGYLFYKPKGNVVFVARRGVFLEREIISKEDSGTKIDLEEIQEIGGRVSKPPRFYYGFHIKEDKISDSTLSELDEPANYKEAMASPKAAKRWDMDVKTAFLNEKLTEDVFMAQPEGFENAKFLVYGGEKELRVTGYCDASWQTYKDDSRSQSGWVFLLNEGAVTWKISKQDIVADFTCESEYIIACEASKEAILMKNFIRDLGVVPTVPDPIEILCDNESAVALTKEPKDQGKSKHIERKYHFFEAK
ncbi:retrotransposon protein, putative, ty1-copia subclass [Tanacetum coccineum]